MKASSSEHQLVLSSSSNAANSNQTRLGFKLHPSYQNERIKAAIVCQGSGGGYGEVSRMMFCIDSVADNGNADGNGVDEKFRIDSGGIIKYGPNLLHQLQSKSFYMYPDNGSNHITRLTFTGLISGTYIAQIGYYNAAGQGYGGGCFHVSGYQTASYTYNVHEIVRWDNAGNSAISSVMKYNSSWVIDITNSHGSYTGGGEVSIHGDAQVTCTITYHT